MESGNAFKITDDRFSIDKIDTYHLVLEVQQSRLKFYLKEDASNAIIWLEDHYLDTQNTKEEFLNKIKDIFSRHDFLKANFWKSITLISDFPCFCKIPEVFYDVDLTNQYLKLHFKDLITEEYQIQTEKLQQDIYIIAFPKCLITTISEIYTNADINLKNSIINNIKVFNKNPEFKSKNLLIISDMWLDVIFQNQSSSMLSHSRIALNSKNIHNFIKEIVKSGQIKSVVYGEITPYSTIYKQLKYYLKAVEFGSLPKSIKLSQYFSEVPEQRYFSLFANN
ncbi:DUF3822 family protein [Lacihabitans sp. LS3-19]|uniref:DUF3822 family protein n=1 Tax=Lacihabitans sp. LS3-19 TaxID=2487335 RepID=UPI0020CFC31B|nr:DUF3822 family protein [Lacihabitans sp. LS3-19]MCP9767601.1 DUF3822 family protein [Lacihabitans sp. LS3-19]